MGFAGDGDGVGLPGDGDRVSLPEDGVGLDSEEDGFALGGLPGVGLDMGLVSLNCNLPLKAK